MKNSAVSKPSDRLVIAPAVLPLALQPQRERAVVARDCSRWVL